MRIEQSGDKVFANVDEALAERIISRSKENCKETEPTVEGMVYPVFNDADNADPLSEFYVSERPISLLKIALCAAALLVLITWMIRRRR